LRVTDNILQYGITWGDNSLIGQKVEHFVKHKDRFTGNPDNLFRFACQLLSLQIATESIIAKMENYGLMFETGSLGDGARGKFAVRKVRLLNPGNILDNFSELEYKKLLHSFEVAELQNKENARGTCMPLRQHSSLVGRQREKMYLIFGGKLGQAVKCSDLIDAENM
jgi:hypothetical protein